VAKEVSSERTQGAGGKAKPFRAEANGRCKAAGFAQQQRFRRNIRSLSFCSVADQAQRAAAPVAKKRRHIYIVRRCQAWSIDQVQAMISRLIKGDKLLVAVDEQNSDAV
jgi:hypothetical protein